MRPGPRIARLALLSLSLTLGSMRPAAGAPARQHVRDDAARPLVISVVATTDVHGHIESLPWLGGYLRNLRARCTADGGGVLLIDSGDMFQGTLESNLGEGAAMVHGYNALGYAAAAIGNHEFDFGPAGPVTLPGEHDDPRGALKARAAEAHFPFLAANLHEKGATRPLAWHNVRPFALVKLAGVRIGIVGAITKSTPFATHPRNFAGLEVDPLVTAVALAARQARHAGAEIVVLTAHAGGECARSDRPDDLGSCLPNEEIFALARALPPHLVDLIAAGHTHQMVAHKVAGIPIVQALAEGRAFSRIDLTIDRAHHTVSDAQIFAPQPLCGGGRVPRFGPEACAASVYEGQPVVFDEAVAAALAPDIERARQRRAAPVGIELVGPMRREVKEESPLGNLAADLLRAAAPGADVAFINGGSLRTSLPAGPLDYGRLYEAFPFDDGLATVHLTAGQLAALVARNLGREFGILSLSGVTAQARCAGAALVVELYGRDGKSLPAARPLVAVTNGYLASGGDGLLTGIATGDLPDATPFRERFVELLRARGGNLRGDDPAIFSPTARRLSYPGRRPVRCP